MFPQDNDYKDEIFKTVFEDAYHCFVVVDRHGFVTYMNNSYCQFLNVDKDSVIGQHVTDVIENSRMHIVAETGIEEIADLQYIRGNHMIANRIPVRANGEIVGAVGTVLFRDTQEWMSMNSHIKDLLLELEQFRKQKRGQFEATYSLHDIVGSSEKMSELKEKVKRIATGDVSVLIRGESGTGKELIAHSIHHLSERNTKPFVKVNCAAIPEHLLESELFGYQEGAFTGAKKGGKPGKFQLADGGTLFLDEIGDMPLSAQVKILRALQEGEIESVGSTHLDKVDVRIIAATNQPLEELLKKQTFREDLFYRINVVQLQIPALRDRPEDIPVLAKYMLHTITQRTGKRIDDFNKEVFSCFQTYEWPGNARELENVIESAVYLTNSECIQMEDIPDRLKRENKNLDKVGNLKQLMADFEKKTIVQALSNTSGDKQKAAELLQIGKSSLYEKIHKYQL
ncbi:sigma-54 interaction domain-containing protein [Alkalicoccobacillus porphyridii]|uniref:PAS domain-containing protein n=1 Tax=Alkalicoccobacillus porphyridii TaxID=2597270 RepID=A0A553ZX29_9BACI|nr:sigma 54-interacting transcriptional regulator [Alkalicoccobacillus porphyridii]TSB46010.1 PAS domain-containing protein [Alkalicoccobacillus porphyridii]